MIRVIVVIIGLFAGIGSAVSADLPLTATDKFRSQSGRNLRPTSKGATKPLPLKSPVVSRKSKATKTSTAGKSRKLEHSMSPAGHASTVRTTGSTSAVAGTDEWQTYVSRYMSEIVSLVVNAPEVIAAVQEQNAAHVSLRAEQIEALDRQWRAERKANGGPLTTATMSNSASQFLKGFKTAANGLIVEIFIMDNKGLNVAQTDPTSDYIQSDEDKWQKSFGAGPWMTFVDKPEQAEDGKRMVQVSTTLVDNDVAIGALTVSLDLDKVPMK